MICLENLETAIRVVGGSKNVSFKQIIQFTSAAVHPCLKRFFFTLETFERVVIVKAVQLIMKFILYDLAASWFVLQPILYRLSYMKKRRNNN